jgi:uncharacterized protein
MYNAEVIFQCDATVDELIDVLEGNRQYIPCLFVYNKIDTVTIEELTKVSFEAHSVVVSCEIDLNIQLLIEKMWDYLDLVRIYTKKKSFPPDFVSPSILRKGATIKDVCNGIHKDLSRKFKYAQVWGKSAKHSPQTVGINHELADGDVTQIMSS